MSLIPSQEDYEAWRLSLADEELFGKNDDDDEFRLPNALKEAVRKYAAERGMSRAAAYRLAAVMLVFGPEHVGILVAKRYGLNPQPALQPAPAPVRTPAPAAQV